MRDEYQDSNLTLPGELKSPVPIHTLTDEEVRAIIEYHVEATRKELQIIGHWKTTSFEDVGRYVVRGHDGASLSR